MVSSNTFKMTNQFPYRIFPLGDAALTIDFGNTIDERINMTVLDLFDQLTSSPLPGQLEAVPAYSSLTIYYNTASLFKTVPSGTGIFDWMSQKSPPVAGYAVERFCKGTTDYHHPCLFSFTIRGG